MKFLDMDDSWPILGSAGFSQGERESVVDFSMQRNQKCSIHVLNNSVCALYVFKVGVTPNFLE